MGGYAKQFNAVLFTKLYELCTKVQVVSIYHQQSPFIGPTFRLCGQIKEKLKIFHPEDLIRAAFLGVRKYPILIIGTQILEPVHVPAKPSEYNHRRENSAIGTNFFKDCDSLAFTTYKSCQLGMISKDATLRSLKHERVVEVTYYAQAADSDAL